MSATLDGIARTGLTAPRARLRRGRTWILISGDLIALTLAYAFTYLAANQMGSLPPVSAPKWFLIVLVATAAPTWLAVYTAYHLYENDNLRISVSSFDEVRDLFHAMLAGSLIYLIVSQGVHYFFGWWVYTAVEAVLFLTGALILVPIIRGSIRSWLLPHVMKRRRTLVVGSGPEARLVQRKIEAHPEYGLELVGFLDGDHAETPSPILGRPDQVADIIEEYEIDRVLLASSVGSHEETLDLMRAVRRPDVHVSIVPRFFEIFTSHSTLDDIEGMPVVTLPPMRLGRSARVLKRSTDILVSGLALFLLAPVLGVIALLIRLDSEGSALYRQPRRGRLGSTFRIVKFRTMSIGAELRRSEVLHMNEVDGPLFKIKGGKDPRVTRVGNFLRSTSLDELPQLWNVFKGDMSLVGPRPFVVYEADKITGWASRRLDMTPGITGLWQVLGRNDIPFEEMTKLDYLYVTNWSIWWDFKILCQTIPVVLGRRGAY